MHGGCSSVGPGDGGGADYASTSRMMSSLASEYAVGVTDIQVRADEEKQESGRQRMVMSA